MSTDSNFVDEQTVDKTIKEMLTQYQTMLKLFNQRYQKLEKEQEKLPHKYIVHDEFEDHLITASQCKHQAIRLLKDSIGALGSIESDIKFVTGQLRLYAAEDFLQDKFDRVTDILRDSYVDSKRDMNDLEKLSKEIKAVNVAADKLVKAFEGDEFVCKGFLNQKNKLKGI